MPSVTPGGYLAGLGFFVPTVAAAGVAAVIVVRASCDYLRGLSRLLAGAVLATAMFLLVHLLPAMLGVLARGTVLASAVLVLIVTHLVSRSHGGRARDAPDRRARGDSISVAIAVLAVLALCGYELTRLRGLLPVPITDPDMLNFHLPGMARLIQTGTVWQVTEFLPGFPTAQYPNNGDLLMLATVLPWHDLAFARMPGLIFFVITGFAIYGLALELRATRAAALTFAAVALAQFQISHFALEGLPDDVALSTLTIGVFFLVRHSETGRTGELALAGLGFGLALGTKWYGLTATAVVLMVWLVTTVARHRRFNMVSRQGGLLLAMVLLGGGFWLLRNLVESGNPLYPKAISLFGVTLFPGSKGDVLDLYGYSIAHYVFRPHVLYRYVYPGFRSQLGITGLVLAIGLLGVVVWFFRGRADSSRRRLLAMVAVIGGIFVTYIITPGSAYGPAGLPIEGFVTLRWLMPAVVIGAAVTAAVASIGTWGVLLEASGLAGLVWSLEHAAEASLASTVAYAAGLSAALLGVWGIWLLIRRRGLLGLGAAVGAAATACLVAGAVLGRFDQTRFDRHGYSRLDPVFAWINENAPTGRRVALTGSIGGVPGIPPALPSFGPRLGNQVVLVGRRVVHTIELPRSITSFRQELRAGRYSLLVIGLPYAGDTDHWARQLGFQSLARSRLIALYAIPAETG